MPCVRLSIRRSQFVRWFPCTTSQMHTEIDSIWEWDKVRSHGDGMVAVVVVVAMRWWWRNVEGRKNGIKEWKQRDYYIFNFVRSFVLFDRIEANLHAFNVPIHTKSVIEKKKKVWRERKKKYPLKRICLRLRCNLIIERLEDSHSYSNTRDVKTDTPLPPQPSSPSTNRIPSNT